MGNGAKRIPPCPRSLRIPDGSFVQGHGPWPAASGRLVPKPRRARASTSNKTDRKLKGTTLLTAIGLDLWTLTFWEIKAFSTKPPKKLSFLQGGQQQPRNYPFLGDHKCVSGCLQTIQHLVVNYPKTWVTATWLQVNISFFRVVRNFPQMEKPKRGLFKNKQFYDCWCPDLDQGCSKDSIRLLFIIRTLCTKTIFCNGAHYFDGEHQASRLPWYLGTGSFLLVPVVCSSSFIFWGGGGGRDTKRNTLLSCFWGATKKGNPIFLFFWGGEPSLSERSPSRPDFFFVELRGLECRSSCTSRAARTRAAVKLPAAIGARPLTKSFFGLGGFGTLLE